MTRKRKGKSPDKERANESAPEPESPQGRKLSTYDHVRENLEALIVAIILAVIIRQFAVEAFEIPTGSMAPTLYGIHAWTDCPNCDTEYNIALRTDSDTGKITIGYARELIYDGPCGNPQGCGMDRHFQNPRREPLTRGEIVRCSACGYSFRGENKNYREANIRAYHSRCPTCQFEFDDILESTNVTGGHKILVTKFAFSLSPPERWDVIVFTFDQWKNYIKRLVAKPGERIDLWDGDVYIDGKIERKYRHPYVQDVLWVKISDSTVAERRLRDHPPAWGELAAKGAGREAVDDMLATWSEKTRRWSVNAAGEVAALEYQRRFDNFYHYNLVTHGTRGYPQSVQVGDRKVEFVVRPVGTESTSLKRVTGAWVGGEIREGEFTFQFRVPVADGSASGRKAVLRRMVTDDGELPDPDRAAFAPAQEVTADAVLRKDAATRVAFANVDDRAAVYLDGELVLALEYESFPEGGDFTNPEWIPPRMPSEQRDAHDLRLFVADSQAEVSDISVYRDMYYIGQYNSNGMMNYEASSVQLKEGQYFALGDNGPSSSDGRFWGFVPESHLMGKAFAVFWPAWPTNFQCKFIR